MVLACLSYRGIEFLIWENLLAIARHRFDEARSAERGGRIRHSILARNRPFSVDDPNVSSRSIQGKMKKEFWSCHLVREWERKARESEGIAYHVRSDAVEHLLSV